MEYDVPSLVLDPLWHLYGSEVTPNEPTQDMSTIDHIAGGDSKDRTMSPAALTGGTGGGGLGGQAEGEAPTKAKVPGGQGGF